MGNQHIPRTDLRSLVADNIFYLAQERINTPNDNTKSFEIYQLKSTCRAEFNLKIILFCMIVQLDRCVTGWTSLSDSPKQVVWGAKQESSTET